MFELWLDLKNVIHFTAGHADPGSKDVKLSIFDNAGKLIHSIRDPEIEDFASGSHHAYKIMMELYDKSKNIALGIDKSIDDIIEYLDKIGESADDGDELPEE